MSQAAQTAPIPDEQYLELQHVSVEFAGNRVLQDIHVSIRRGQTVGIIGESGCGKTVTLKLIIGLLQPTQGRVRFDGRYLDELSDKEMTQQRLRFGFLFQGAALFDSLTVYENVAFSLREQGHLSPSQIREVVLHRLQEVGLPPGVELRKPAQLSGGMKKRVGLARALVVDPEVMLYDEPTTGLDPIMSDVINELILQTRRRRPVTGIVVTHDMRTVQKVADRVIMFYPLARLRPGEPQILFDGPPETLHTCEDSRVRQFIEGQAQERLLDLARTGS